MEFTVIGELGITVARDVVLGEEDPKLLVKTRSCLHPPCNTLLSVLTETHKLP